MTPNMPFEMPKKEKEENAVEIGSREYMNALQAALEDAVKYEDMPESEDYVKFLRKELETAESWEL